MIALGLIIGWLTGIAIYWVADGWFHFTHKMDIDVDVAIFCSVFWFCTLPLYLIKLIPYPFLLARKALISARQRYDARLIEEEQIRILVTKELDALEEELNALEDELKWKR